MIIKYGLEHVLSSSFSDFLVHNQGGVCVILWSLFCNNYTVHVTFAYRNKNLAIIAYNTIINIAKNASRYTILGYKGIVGLQNKH